MPFHFTVSGIVHTQGLGIAGDIDMRTLLNSLELGLETNRLILEPINEGHAPEMVELLADPDLHTFVPSDPPTVEKLQSQYKYWESRISPQEDELWLNWVGRSKSDGRLIGHFQAGVKRSLEASIAYTVGKEFQRSGYAYEGLTKIMELLFVEVDAESVKAWIDTRNQASIGLVKKLGMSQIEFIAKADYFKGTDSDEFVFSVRKDQIKGNYLLNPPAYEGTKSW